MAVSRRLTWVVLGVENKGTSQPQACSSHDAILRPDLVFMSVNVRWRPRCVPGGSGSLPAVKLGAVPDPQSGHAAP